MNARTRHNTPKLLVILCILLIFIYIFAISAPHASVCESHDCPICLLRSLWQLLWIPLLLTRVLHTFDEGCMLFYARHSEHTAHGGSPIDRYDKLSD